MREPSFTEIHQEMSEILDKQMNAQKESIKILLGFTQAPTSPRKVCDENESRKMMGA